MTYSVGLKNGCILTDRYVRYTCMHPRYHNVRRQSMHTHTDAQKHFQLQTSRLVKVVGEAEKTTTTATGTCSKEKTTKDHHITAKWTLILLLLYRCGRLGGGWGGRWWRKDGFGPRGVKTGRHIYSSSSIKKLYYIIVMIFRYITMIYNVTLTGNPGVKWG